MFKKGYKQTKEHKKKMVETRIKNNSYKGINKGRHHTEEAKEKNRLAHLGNIPWNKGKKGVMPIPWNKGSRNGELYSDESLKKMSEVHKGKSNIRGKNKKKFPDSWFIKQGMRIGENSGRWIKDRTKLKNYDIDSIDRRSVAYNEWRRQVWVRDNYKCKINNSDCNGRLESHHILAWRDHPKLRYEINNGITLCHYHHPRKRKDEENSVLIFQDMIVEKEAI